MQRHYIYRIDHDLGFAPHIDNEFCILCGCKTTTVEKWAKNGSWIIGIGGKGTGKNDLLIYAMKVEETTTYYEFKKSNPSQSAYLKNHNILSLTLFIWISANTVNANSAVGLIHLNKNVILSLIT